MITVQTSNDECQIFKKRKIVDSLLKETEVKESEAMKIARSVERQIKKIEGQIITSAQIRELVNAQLIKRGDVKSARMHERVGIPSAEIRSLIRGTNFDNANLQRNPETTHKFVADAALKQYALSCLPAELAQAHDKGEIHIHDLEYFPARPINCLQHDLRWFIRNGLMVDGSGEHTSVAAPPRRLETLMNHAGEIMLAGQQNCSGGQGMSLWNVFVAPFARGLTYKQIKQCVQMFIYNLNMAYSNRGGQVPFTSINLEFTVPDFLKNETAWGPAGKECGVYGDYEEETRLVNRAFIEVMLEGDAMGKPHLFPNSIWVLREEMMTDEFEDDLQKVHELSAKYSTPYFASCIPDFTGGHSNVMGCRTRLNSNWTNDWDRDTLRTGNLAYITINLPRIAYKANKDEDAFFEELDRVLGLAEQVLLIRREHAIKCLGEFNLLPFLSQEVNGEMYYRIDNATLSFGVVGVNEMLQAMGYDGLGFPADFLASNVDTSFAVRVMEHINQYIKDLIDETGYRWTVLQTPAETTANRFATLDKKHFPDKVIYKGGTTTHNLLRGHGNDGTEKWVQGEEGSEYYTNSTHVPVDSHMLIPEKIKVESIFHPLTSGGHIMHTFIGEAYPDMVAISKLTKKIATKSDIGFWAYTSAFSYCFNCNQFMRGMQYQCVNSKCGSTEDIEHYSRITGYMQQVGDKRDAAGGWNKGKRQELKDRYQHNCSN